MGEGKTNPLHYSIAPVWHEPRPLHARLLDSFILSAYFQSLRDADFPGFHLLLEYLKLGVVENLAYAFT